MIKIHLSVKEGNAELHYDAEEMSVADLQAAITNLELLKINMLGQLAKMTDIHNERKGEMN